MHDRAEAEPSRKDYPTMTATTEAEAEAWPGAPAEDEPLWAAAVITPTGVVVTAGPFGDHYSATAFAREVTLAGLTSYACELQSPAAMREFLGLPQPRPVAEDG
jgi:hypothetical protein